MTVKSLKSTIIVILLCFILFANTFAQNNDSNRWSVRMAESAMIYGYQGIYYYVTTTAMKGFRQLWQVTGNERYFQHIKDAVDDDLDQFHDITS